MHDLYAHAWRAGISALPDQISQVVVHSRRKGGFFSIVKGASMWP